MRFLGHLRERAYEKFGKSLIRSYKVEGTLKDSGRMFRCLFITNSALPEYLLSRIFEGKPSFERLSRLWPGRIQRSIVSPPFEFDLGFAVLPPALADKLSRHCTYRGHETVRQYVDTEGSWENVIRKIHRKKRELANRLSRQEKLPIHLTRDPAAFERFYHTMYLPHINKRFGEFAAVDTFDEMKPYFDRGFLLEAHHEGQAIAANLCFERRGILVYRRCGVRDGNHTVIKGGTQNALFYAMLRHAHEHGLQSVDAMMSPAFFHDGVFRNKREWGARITPDKPSSAVLLLFNPRGANLADFFRLSPMIVEAREGLMGVVAEDSSAPTDDQSLLKEFYAPGLSGLYVHSPQTKEVRTLRFGQNGSHALPSILIPILAALEAGFRSCESVFPFTDVANGSLSLMC